MNRIKVYVKKRSNEVALAVVAGILFTITMKLYWFTPVLIIFFIFYAILLFKKPELALLFSILAIFDLFSLLPEDYLRLPNIFRLKDIFLILIFVTFLKGIFSKYKKVQYFPSSLISKCIIILLTMTIAQIIATKMFYPQESISSIFRAGRVYFYYALYFPAYMILNDRDRLHNFLRLLIGCVCIFCVMFVFQFFVGNQINIFAGKIAIQELQGFQITRMYLMGAGIVSLFFIIMIMILIFSPIKLIKNSYILIIVLTGLQVILSFGRAYIGSVLFGCLFGFFIALKERKGIAIFRIVVAIAGIIFVMSIMNIRGQNLFDAFATRMSSTYDAIFNVRDTFEVRWLDSLGRIELIKKNPFIGIGFVHDESETFSYYKGFGNALRTSDSGILTLLIDYGLVGFVWLLFISIVFIRKCIRLYKKIRTVSRYYVLGILAFYVGRLVSFITLADFVTYDGIVIIVLCYVIIEVIENQHNVEILD